MSGNELPKSALIVQQALDDLGCTGRVAELPSSTRTAPEAADTLGCALGAIVKSLVFIADDQPLLALVSGIHRVDVDVLAARTGATLVRQAGADEVRRHTGQSIGGVAPVGHRQTLRAVLDRALAEHPILWAAAGTPRSVFSTTFEELQRITAAAVIDIG